jgi:hypothetical protein
MIILPAAPELSDMVRCRVGISPQEIRAKLLYGKSSPLPAVGAFGRGPLVIGTKKLEFVPEAKKTGPLDRRDVHVMKANVPQSRAG